LLDGRHFPLAGTLRLTEGVLAIHPVYSGNPTATVLFSCLVAVWVVTGGAE
jgi:hypothetical protein